jgi:hypothetical protein
VAGYPDDTETGFIEKPGFYLCLSLIVFSSGIRNIRHAIIDDIETRQKTISSGIEPPQKKIISPKIAIASLKNKPMRKILH